MEQLLHFTLILGYQQAAYPKYGATKCKMMTQLHSSQIHCKSPLSPLPLSFPPVQRRMFDTGILTISVGLQDQNQIGDL
jgi:hypothetical protein